MFPHGSHLLFVCVKTIVGFLALCVSNMHCQYIFLWVGVVKSVFTFINIGAVIVGLFMYFKTSHKNLHCKAFPGFWRVTKEVVVICLPVGDK